jgi:hypothetical protein
MSVEQLKEALEQLGIGLWTLLTLLFQWALQWLLAAAWFAWWLWGVNWSKTWPVLRQGAWVGLVLIVITSALVWSQMAPSECTCLGFVTVANFWWQLGAVGLLTALTLFCGWLQGVFGWAPAEIDLEPSESAGDHDAGHAHH